MEPTRMQISLTPKQRKLLEARRKREHKTISQLVRDAIDAYLTSAPPAEPPMTKEDYQKVLDRTFGSIPDLEVPPRSEWNRRARRLGY